MDHILALIGRAHQGDKEARDTLVEENIGLVWSIVKRFGNRGVEMEDLFQIGSIGLLKAIDKFDTSFDVKFSTYAVPMIAGEIKRFLRDDGMIKVSRSMKEISYKAYVTREELERSTGREPTLLEIANELQVTQEELVMAMEAGSQIESLQKTIYQGDGSDISLEEKLEEKKDHQEALLNRLLLEEILGTLEAQDRKLIYMRFFQERTQSEIAKEMGISQVQVSRMEKRILQSLRGKL
ncbi:SigF/SigG family RNA polymerase sporulation sigma factor [Lactonifactor longoviformis]|uniref:SigF/SigG family RNA polymerase sporulation sigma factor n=1 Tax=Lactonifactor TaxID=420345 RepID=UPI0012AF4692|nr:MULTISPECIES: SigF/SigG family RNA polymerase sporulation sigma factor [Lactonifactor]MCB5712207.1 SigF/SigG family RNA polymerase sporulation sigma factor [Lactonifactor longoviformis]MCB5716251.1 SigF/SigG family RNA polymerase sporulation sigma factor [Lactonifactor longoviformis]MCQ4670669.1 SigF/SigG family RNA polymerase sporulation sigma factor [Lactonifactor longoviformis]MSA00450.1 SigB/SigF/SigG family RNA polymerase sigma factor [Lactonifactor sp. BIOML-A5]MSA06418.1 SigB/SigF/Si